MRITCVLAVLGLALGVTSAAVEARQLVDCTPVYTSPLVWGGNQICCNYFGPSSVSIGRQFLLYAASELLERRLCQSLLTGDQTMENCCDRQASTPSGANYCGTHFADKDCPLKMPYMRLWAPEAHLCCNGQPEVRQVKMSREGQLKEEDFVDSCSYGKPTTDVRVASLL
ncbi:hypothetical protein ACHAQH_002097 [Verticillium albo-atrum]